MENYIKTSLQGEILIPLENIYKSNHFSNLNNKNNSNINELSLSKIFDNDYKSYRSIVFKNEFIHFFLVIHLDHEDESKYINNTKSKKYSMNINELNEYLDNNCSINISYSKVYGEEDEVLEYKENEANKKKEDINFTLEEWKDIKYINNGILVKKEIVEEKNIIIYELYSKIKLKEGNNNYINNKKIEMIVTITSNQNSNSYSNFDINDIHIINYLNINDNENSLGKKYTLLSINKILSIVNPLNIIRIGQFGCGSNKYLITIKIENITYKINFLDKSLKNSIFLKKQNMPDDEFLYYEFPIVINDIYINGDKTTIEDLIIINFLKFEQERKKEEKYEINSKKLKFNLVNNKFPIIIRPKEVFNLIINIEKQYDYLMISDLSAKNRKSQINKLANLTLSTPICLNIFSNKPINNLIWSFLFRWKDEFNNKLNIIFKIDNGGDDEANKGIKLYQFFKVYFIISKSHKEKVKFELRFNNSYDEFNLNKNLLNRESKSIIGDGLPDILPEKKIIEVEMKENESSKIIEMRYIPIRTEYIELPPFEIFDCLLNKIYFVFFTNKIYVNE